MALVIVDRRHVIVDRRHVIVDRRHVIADRNQVVAVPKLASEVPTEAQILDPVTVSVVDREAPRGLEVEIRNLTAIEAPSQVHLRAGVDGRIAPITIVHRANR